LAKTKKDKKPKIRLWCLKKYNFLSRSKGKKLQKKTLNKINEAHVDPGVEIKIKIMKREKMEQK
jgi:hypothetical protein